MTKREKGEASEAVFVFRIGIDEHGRFEIALIDADLEKLLYYGVFSIETSSLLLNKLRSAHMLRVKDGMYMTAMSAADLEAQKTTGTQPLGVWEDLSIDE